MPAVDYQKLFVNDAYLRATLTSREADAGQREAQDVAHKLLRRVLSAGRAQHLAVQRYDVPRRVGLVFFDRTGTLTWRTFTPPEYADLSLQQIERLGATGGGGGCSSSAGASTTARWRS